MLCRLNRLAGRSPKAARSGIFYEQDHCQDIREACLFRLPDRASCGSLRRVRALLGTATKPSCEIIRFRPHAPARAGRFFFPLPPRRVKRANARAARPRESVSLRPHQLQRRPRRRSLHRDDFRRWTECKTYSRTARHPRRSSHSRDLLRRRRECHCPSRDPAACRTRGARDREPQLVASGFCENVRRQSAERIAENR